MNLLLAGGNGHIGSLILRHLGSEHTFTILTRSPKPNSAHRQLAWDARTLGPWADELNHTDIVINLAGRSVDCRYTPRNRDAMLASRLDSTRVLGEAIARAHTPPTLWLQASTATYYAHRFDAPNDELTGKLGDEINDRPARWNFSTHIARRWEETLFAAPTPHTRRVALRSAITLSPDPGSIFDVLARLTRLGLGGTQGDGRQMISWIHETDFAHALRFLIARPELEGPINLCSPHPLPNREFFSALRSALGTRLALPAPRWLLEIGAFFLRTETELLLKSRYVIPTRLLRAGFIFQHPQWPAAARDLTAKLASQNFAAGS